MSAYVKPQDYLKAHERLYTASFVAEGGSAVRAALGSLSLREKLRAGIQRDAESKKFVYVRIDSSDVKIQQLQDVFFAISRTINWSGAVRRWVRRKLSERFDLDESDMTLSGILRRDSREAYIVRQRIDELLTEEILRKPGLCGEFRRAVYQLVWAALEPRVPKSDVAPHVVAWLQGSLEKIVLVKPAFLFRRITKANARQMLTSLSRWLRDCGFLGLVVTVDLGAVMTLPKYAIGLRYSRAALIDAYEVLRQFIDTIDEVEGLVLLVLGDEAFADDPKRGTLIYRALRMRLSDDVWDSRKANPMAPMVRLTE